MGFKRKIGEFNSNGVMERYFESVTVAAKSVGYCERYIRESCKGKRVINGKYYMYLDKDNKPIIINGR